MSGRQSTSMKVVHVAIGSFACNSVSEVKEEESMICIDLDGIDQSHTSQGDVTEAMTESQPSLYASFALSTSDSPQPSNVDEDNDEDDAEGEDKEDGGEGKDPNKSSSTLAGASRLSTSLASITAAIGTIFSATSGKCESIYDEGSDDGEEDNYGGEDGGGNYNCSSGGRKKGLLDRINTRMATVAAIIGSLATISAVIFPVLAEQGIYPQRTQPPTTISPTEEPSAEPFTERPTFTMRPTMTAPITLKKTYEIDIEQRPGGESTTQFHGGDLCHFCTAIVLLTKNYASIDTSSNIPLGTRTQNRIGNLTQNCIEQNPGKQKCEMQNSLQKIETKCSAMAQAVFKEANLVRIYFSVTWSSRYFETLKPFADSFPKFINDMNSLEEEFNGDYRFFGTFTGVEIGNVDKVIRRSDDIQSEDQCEGVGFSRGGWGEGRSDLATLMPSHQAIATPTPQPTTHHTEEMGKGDEGDLATLMPKEEMGKDRDDGDDCDTIIQYKQAEITHDLLVTGATRLDGLEKTIIEYAILDNYLNPSRFNISMVNMPNLLHPPSIQLLQIEGHPTSALTLVYGLFWSFSDNLCYHFTDSERARYENIGITYMDAVNQMIPELIQEMHRVGLHRVFNASKLVMN